MVRRSRGRSWRAPSSPSGCGASACSCLSPQTIRPGGSFIPLACALHRGLCLGLKSVNYYYWRRHMRDDAIYMKAALTEACKSYDEGGVPVGSVLVSKGKIIGSGHNRRVQDSNPIAHGEMNCFQNAGRR